MTLATTPRGSESCALPPLGASQSRENRTEQILVHELLNDVVNELTDRLGTSHAFPWAPDQQVRIGVLGPKYLPSAALGPGSAGGDTGSDGGTDDEVPGVEHNRAEIAAPIENRGVIGVDFVVDGAIEREIELGVEIEYALYHPLVPDFAEVSAEAQRRAGAATGNRRRRPRVPINPSWIRDNRHVRFNISLPLGEAETERSSQDVPGGDPLEADAAAAVTAHYATPDALWKLAPNQTLPVADAMGSEVGFGEALVSKRDPDWMPTWPLPRLTVTSSQTPTGDIGISVSITNARELSDRQRQDLAIYDTRMEITVNSPARLRPQRLGFADDDARYAEAATVVGRGRGCVARPGENPNALAAETLPVHIQRVSQSVTHGADLTFTSLATDYEPALSTIATAMRSFLRAWDPNVFADEREREQSSQLRAKFELEVAGFELGCDLLRADPKLARAFRLANRAFAGAKGAQASWRLFQFVFIVRELGALAGRLDPSNPRLRDELDSVDVLWFPTGGGKTEAYLGLIVVALFFDRLRDKLRGTSAWLLFPLRMLSVQQLARMSEIIHHAEAVRVDESIGGDPFTLGYLVGAGNTPNRLAYADANGWWQGIQWFTDLSEEERDQRRLVGACPSCGASDSVGLDTDIPAQRLLHVCRQCHHLLPIYASDEEVTRFQPAVVVSTVDKITSFSRNGELTSFNRGPRRKCPDHGWYTHAGCVVPSCSTDQSTHLDPTGFLDPTPALWIQDELHLVREDLGVFAAHYHTLLAELASGGGNYPSKVIAATATIEQYEDQLSQVYGRHPRLFPVGGPTLERSFYSEVTDDVRRVYLGLLPAGGGTVKVDVAASITTQLIERVHRLTDDPAPLLAALASEGISPTRAEVAELLFDYELALCYVNAKAHGTAVLDDINRLSVDLINEGSDRVDARYLMGETTLGELASVVAAVQSNLPTTPRADRIRALVGTAVISHGVDLDRLNFEVLAGMPPSYAQYIQATARAGRAHVGLVVSVFDRNNRRETSMFQSFATTHAALEKMVEPVPVNRFASRAVVRTLPGIVCALLWDETRNASWPSVEGISMTRRFRPWWNANAANLMPHLRGRIERAYRCPVPDPAMAHDEQTLVEDALERWENVERLRMQNWQADWVTELFTIPAMTSLRDVERPVDFSGGNRAMQIIARLEH
jgi:hypothetical protein